MKKEGVVVYPLDSEFLPILRHQREISEQAISYLVSPKGWDYVGKDAGAIDGGSPIGLTVSSDFDKALHECGTAVFVDTTTKVNFEKMIYPKMLEAAEQSKNIICLRHLEEEQKKAIEDICREKASEFQYCFHDEAYRLDHPLASEELFDIDTPIVFVLGASERTNKFGIQMALREHLLKNNYVVSQVGSRQYCEAFGFHSFPDFMYSSSVREYEKIVLFNHFIKNIEIKENPDIILIGIPGAMMPMSNKLTNKFGVFAFEVSQAVKPDVAVFSSFCNLAADDFFALLSQNSKHRLGFELDCFYLTNTAFDLRCLTDTFLWDSLSLTLDRDMVSSMREKVGSPAAPVYSMVDAQDAQRMTDFIIQKLNGYADTQAV